MWINSITQNYHVLKCLCISWVNICWKHHLVTLSIDTEDSADPKHKIYQYLFCAYKISTLFLRSFLGHINLSKVNTFCCFYISLTMKINSFVDADISYKTIELSFQDHWSKFIQNLRLSLFPHFLFLPLYVRAFFYNFFIFTVINTNAFAKLMYWFFS